MAKARTLARETVLQFPANDGLTQEHILTAAIGATGADSKANANEGNDPTQLASVA